MQSLKSMYRYSDVLLAPHHLRIICEYLAGPNDINLEHLTCPNFALLVLCCRTPGIVVKTLCIDFLLERIRANFIVCQQRRLRSYRDQENAVRKLASVCPAGDNKIVAALLARLSEAIDPNIMARDTCFGSADPRQDVRKQILRALTTLGNAGDVRIVHTIFGLLKEPETPSRNHRFGFRMSCKSLCFQLLAKIAPQNDPAVVNHIVPFLSHEHYQQDALKCIKELFSSSNEALSSVLLELLRSNNNLDFLREVLQIVPRLVIPGDAVTIKAIITCFEYASDDLRPFCIRAMQEISGRRNPHIARMLCEFASKWSCSPGTVESIIRAMPKLACPGDAQAIAICVACLPSTRRSTRVCALFGLQKLGIPGHAYQAVSNHVLSIQLDDDTPHEKCLEKVEALFALGKVAKRGDEKAIEICKAAIASSSEPVLGAGLDTLGAIAPRGDQSIKQIVLLHIQHKHPWVREGAIMGLGGVSPESELLTTLAPMLDSSDDETRSYATQSLATHAAVDNLAAISKLYLQLESAGWQTRYMAVRGLRRYGDVGRSQDIKSLLDDEKDLVRLSAREALAEFVGQAIF